MNDVPHRIRIRFGEAEFEAEGSADVVGENYARFMALLETKEPPAPRPVDRPREEASAVEQPQGRTAEGPPGDTEALGEEELRRLFLQHGSLVSLRLLPHGKEREVDALLLILLGYRLLRQQHDVMATQLMKAAKQSGLQVGRLDRTIGKQTAQVTSGGSGRGKRYALNNQGVRKAEQIARSILGGA